MKYPKRWYYNNTGKKLKPIKPMPLQGVNLDGVLTGNENALTMFAEYYPEKRYKQKLRAMWLSMPF